jgi:hypothetical protein
MPGANSAIIYRADDFTSGSRNALGLDRIACSPLSMWMCLERRIVVTAISGDFIGEPVRPDEDLISMSQLDLGHHQSGVFTGELVHLKKMIADRHPIAHLVDNAGFTQGEQRLGIFNRDRLFPLEAAGAACITDALYSEIALVALDAYPNGTGRIGLQVALNDALMVSGLAR